MSWNSGTYLYWFLSQIFISIKLQFPSGKFYAKGKEKTESLQSHLQKEMKDLDTRSCSKVEENVTPIKFFTCALHTLYLPENKRKDIALKEKHSYFYIG